VKLGRKVLFLSIFALFASSGFVPFSADGLVDAQARDGGERPFTSDERARLDRGELVVRPTHRQRGALRLVGGASWQVVQMPPEGVWRALLDTPAYTHMIPLLAHARVVSRVADRRLVYMEHQSGPMNISYYLNTHVQNTRRDLTFTIDAGRPHSITAAWGFFTVRPYEGGRSLISFGIMADVGDGMFAGFLRPRVHSWMMRVPSMMRSYIEGNGRLRYLPTNVASTR
jgi:ribosome-associated toxin RatA of RatAB toxin-antitoxin module